MMRIIAGRFKGRTLAPPGNEAIRPTSDRMREALFNVLTHRLHHEFATSRVLDLFAGTGALGCEALSRGAKAAVFVEQSAEGRGIIHENLENLSLHGVGRILRRDATRLGAIGTMQPFNLVFADPPYAQGLGEKALISAHQGGWLCPDALLVLEESIQANVQLPSSFTLADARVCGKTITRIYHINQENKIS